MSGRIPWAMNRAIIRRRCIVSRAGGGSATLHAEDEVWHACMLPLGEGGGEARGLFPNRFHHVLETPPNCV
jgi:hypothetical protein